MLQEGTAAVLCVASYISADLAEQQGPSKCSGVTWHCVSDIAWSLQAHCCCLLIEPVFTLVVIELMSHRFPVLILL